MCRGRNEGESEAYVPSNAIPESPAFDVAGVNKNYQTDLGCDLGVYRCHVYVGSGCARLVLSSTFYTTPVVYPNPTQYLFFCFSLTFLQPVK